MDHVNVPSVQPDSGSSPESARPTVAAGRPWNRRRILTIVAILAAIYVLFPKYWNEGCGMCRSQSKNCFGLEYFTDVGRIGQPDEKVVRFFGFAVYSDVKGGGSSVSAGNAYGLGEGGSIDAGVNHWCVGVATDK